MAIQTIKFSEMTPGGDIANGNEFPGLLSGSNVLFDIPWTFLPPGSTADRPPPSADINYRLRFNTDDQLYEYYDAVAGQWTQIQESLFTAGPFIIYEANSNLPDAFNLGSLTTGILKQTVLAGVATPSIAINGTDYYGPGFTGYMQSPAGFKDVSGNILLQMDAVSNAVNYIQLSNAATGNAPYLAAFGSDTNVNLNLQPQGTGQLQILSNNATPVIFLSGTGFQHATNFIFPNTNASQNVTFQDASGTVAYLSDIPGGSPSALTEVNDTNVTLTLGGTPSTALLQAVSITAGWTGQLSPARGGTGVNNGSNTLTLGGNTAFSGAFTFTGTVTGNTSVTFPTSGTLATTSQLPSGAALTEVNDTNVTMTLGGTPATALLQAVSMTLGWTGQLALTRGGTNASLTASNGGIVYSTSSALAILSGTATANLPLLSGSSAAPSWGSFALNLGGALTTAGAHTLSGAFASTFTFTNTTSVTFPTSGTLATTSQLPTPAALTEVNDTNVTMTLGGTPSTALLQSVSMTLGWTGQLSLTRGGTNASLTASNGGIVYSTASAFAVLSGTATAGQMLQSGSSTTPAWSTATWPASTTINQILYSSSANTVAGLSTANSSVLVTSSGGVPSFSTTLPSGISATNMVLTTPQMARINDTNGNEMLLLAPAASAVNYLTMTNAATTAAPVLGSAGSDTNVGMALFTQGVGSITLGSNGGTSVLALFSAVANSVDYIQFVPAATANPATVTIAALGSDSNINLELAPKGTGKLFVGNSGSFSANGSVSTVLGSLGPTGSHTTVQTWLAILDNGGVTRYIPCF